MQLFRGTQETSRSAKGRNLDHHQKESDKSETALVKLQWEERSVKAACNTVRLNLVFLVPRNVLT